MKNFKNLREDMHDRINPYMLWKNKEPVKYSMHLTNTFGPPAELTPFRAVWYAKDGFKRIVVKDEYILHGSPAPHYDFIYCYIDLKVPHDIADDLANSSESILIDFLKNEVGARCGSITANAVTLNYVLDVVAGRAKPTKQEYEKRILKMKDMFESGKIYTTSWWPDETKDADPKNPYYNKEDIENVDEAARIPRKAGQPAKSDKHSDLYTDEDPKGTIHGLKFATTEDAKRSVRKIKSSGRAHAHKIQAAIAMEQRAKVAGKTQAAAVYRSFIEQMKKKTKKMNEQVDERVMATLGRVAGQYVGSKIGMDAPGAMHGEVLGSMADAHLHKAKETAKQRYKKFRQKVKKTGYQFGDITKHALGKDHTNEETIDEANPVKAMMMRAKARMSPTYNLARKELKDRVKKDPNKPKISHAAAVAKKYDDVDAKTLHDVTEERKGLYYYINKKRKEGRPMRKKGAPGAPKPSDFERAKTTASEEAQPTIGGIKMKKLGKGKPGGYKSLVSRHLGASAAEKIDKSDGAKLVAKGKKTGNKELVRKGHFIKNVISKN